MQCTLERQPVPSWETFALVELRSQHRLLTGRVDRLEKGLADEKQAIEDGKRKIKRYLILAAVWAVATGLNIAPKETAQILMSLLKAIAEAMIKTG